MTSHSLYSLLSEARDCGFLNLAALQALLMLSEHPASVPVMADHLGLFASTMLTEAVDLIHLGMAEFVPDGTLQITDAGRDHLVAILAVDN